MGSRRKVVPEAVEEVKAKVGRWREERQRRGPMPEELWAAAVAAAQRHGVAVMAREAGLDYGNLKKRVKAGTGGEEAGIPGGFMEVGAGSLAEVLGGGGAEVEVWDGEGRRLKVGLPGREGLDVAAVVRAFRGEAQ